MQPYDQQRREMVEKQLMPRGIKDSAVLKSMKAVPRHCFVPDKVVDYAYVDGPLPIGEGQTISQPYIVALMTQAASLKNDDTVLEIGTGSGYAAAVAGQIASEVYTVERIASLSERAEKVYRDLGYKNIHVKVDDGTMGWPAKGPFDAIIVTAGGPEVPKALLQQLKVGGRLVIPVGGRHSQELIRITNAGEGEFPEEHIEFVRFVPLVGKQGWQLNQEEMG